MAVKNWNKAEIVLKIVIRGFSKLLTIILLRLLKFKIAPKGSLDFA